MSFSAQTCLTNTGTTTLGSTIVFYSDVDGYFTSFGSTSTTNIVGGSCPFTITGIPDGTTSIRLYDPTSNCCVNIPIQSNDFCVTCDLDFTVLSSTTVSQIVAGNLTGSCDNITDYVVYWYGPNSSTNIGYISGKGSAFSYQFTHPLTGTSAIFAQAGTYTPIIDKVKISGLTFSQTGGSGNYLANLECFSPITVNALTCSNGNQPTSAYTHFYSFSGASQGIASPPLQATFQISANTDYFAWMFRGYSVPDSLKFSYSGANYPTPLVIDNTILGENLTSSNLTWSNYLKSADTSSNLQRVICLTGLTRSPGNEYILIDLVPNSGFTNWELSVGCIDFDCSKCMDDYLNQPYKIVLSGVTALTYNSSDVLVSDFSASCYTRIRFLVSGCTLSPYQSSDYNKYINQSVPGFVSAIQNSTLSSDGIIGGGSIGLQSSQKLFYNGSNCDSFGSSSINSSFYTCATPDPTSTIFYSKYVSGTCPSCVGVIYFEFNQLDDLSVYYNNYNEALTSNSSWYYSACTLTSGNTFNGGSVNGPFSGGTWTGVTTSPYDNTDYRYYRHLWLAVPTATGTTNCGQNTEGGGGGFIGNFTGAQGFKIHPSSIVTSGITGSNYYLQVIMNTVSYGATFSPCAIDCSGTSSQGGARYIVNEINNSSTGSSNNFSATTNTGSYFTNPWSRNYGIFMDCETVSGYTQSGWMFHSNWSYNTLPFSSSTGPMNSFSAETCTAYGESAGIAGKYQYVFQYSTRLLNAVSTDFEIWGNTLTNGVRSGTQTLALRYSGGSFTYIDPNFVIN